MQAKQLEGIGLKYSIPMLLPWVMISQGSPLCVACTIVCDQDQNFDQQQNGSHIWSTQKYFMTACISISL